MCGEIERECVSEYRMKRDRESVPYCKAFFKICV